jgi:hypothetical protein
MHGVFLHSRNFHPGISIDFAPVLVSTLTLLFGRTKLALIINYLFTLNSGFVFNRHLKVPYSVVNGQVQGWKSVPARSAALPPFFRYIVKTSSLDWTSESSHTNLIQI